MLVALKLLLLSRNENHMLSGNLLIHSTLKRRITRVDTTIDRCHYMRGQTVSTSSAGVTPVDVFSTVFMMCDVTTSEATGDGSYS